MGPGASSAYPLHVAAGHLIARLPEGLALIDTGAPITLPAWPELRAQVESPIDSILGLDQLNGRVLGFDVGASQLVFEPPWEQGEVIPLRRRFGVPVMPLGCNGNSLDAILDTGAQLSYAPLDVVESGTAHERCWDFAPGIAPHLGRYEVETSSVPVRGWAKPEPPHGSAAAGDSDHARSRRPAGVDCGRRVVHGWMGNPGSQERPLGLAWPASRRTVIMDPIATIAFDAADLASQHPPAYTNANKQTVHAKAAAGPAPAGRINFSRWPAPELAAWSRGDAPALDTVPGFFRYSAPDTDAERHWHVNFANYDVFSCYAGSLLAQDELQVLEHPALASVRLAVLAQGASTLCTAGREPFPILVSGIERRIAFDTAPSASAPKGLYGNQFAAAPVEKVLEAATALDPPSISNILAIEAPAHGTGRYSADIITSILRAAAAGFRAAVLEPGLVRQLPDARTVIHTGFWGCGAFGGNRVIMTLLQLVAAELAGVDRLVFYTADAAGVRDVEEARTRHAELPRDARPEALVDAVEALGYEWGVGNGT